MSPLRITDSKALGDNGQDLVPYTVAMNIVDLFETVEVEKKYPMGCAGAGRCGDGRLERFFVLTAIRQTREAVLVGKFARVLLGCNARRYFALLSKILSNTKNEQAERNQRTNQKRFVEFNGCFMNRDRAFVGKDVHFIGIVERNHHAHADKRQFPYGDPVANDKASYSIVIHGKI